MEEIKINKFTTKQFLILLAVIVVIGLGVTLSITTSKSESVAKVDGKSITKDELYETMLKENGALMLEVLIENKILDIELKKAKESVDKADIQAEIETYYETYGDEAGLEAALEQSGLTMEAFEKNVEKIIKMNKLLSKEVEVTEEDTKAYFDENITSFDEPERVEVSHVMLEDEATAKEVAVKLADGEKFAELATEYSPDAGGEGGSLGYLTKEEMPPNFSEAAFALEVDKISEPVEVDGVYHIILVTDKKPAKKGVYEENKEMITDILTEQAIQAEYPEWYETKQEEYKVKNSLKK